jgi:hypothetical protein
MSSSVSNQLRGRIDELVSELKGSKDQQIIMVGEVSDDSEVTMWYGVLTYLCCLFLAWKAPSGKRQRLETHEPGKTWLDVMVDRRYDALTVSHHSPLMTPDQQ